MAPYSRHHTFSADYMIRSTPMLWDIQLRVRCFSWTFFSYHVFYAEIMHGLRDFFQRTPNRTLPYFLSWYRPRCRPVQYSTVQYSTVSYKYQV